MPSWRDVLKIHPACELFPLMSQAELKELGEDIKKNGLPRSPCAPTGRANLENGNSSMCQRRS
jgi:hypothetical protein